MAPPAPDSTVRASVFVVFCEQRGLSNHITHGVKTIEAYLGKAWLSGGVAASTKHMYGG